MRKSVYLLARQQYVTAAILAAGLLMHPTLTGPASAQSRACKTNYKLPKNVANCSELAPFGSGVTSVWLVRPNGALQYWWLGPKSRSRVPGAIAVAARDAYVFVTKGPTGIQTARYRVHGNGQTTERVIATYAADKLVPQLSSSGQEGAISPNRKRVALTLKDPAYVGSDDKRQAVDVINTVTQQFWRVEAPGYQELLWESDTILRIGSRTFNTETGAVQ